MTVPVLERRKPLTRNQRVRVSAGEKHGRWTLIERAGIRGGAALWRAKCECGTERVVEGRHLTAGRSVSCGCFKIETAGDGRRTHGASETLEYGIWSRMIARCENAASSDYPRYGGRGIKVCKRWREDFEAFRTDMGPRPSALHSIDRINVNGNYEPKNCRWATPKQQGNNTRRNHYVTVRGKRMTLAQAVDQYGGVYGTVKWRIYQGQSVEEALRI